MMTNYKAIATVTWVFDSDMSHDECLEFTRKKLEGILDCDPSGHDFYGFNVQLDIAKMKSRKKLIHLADFDPDAVFPHVGEEKREYKSGDQSYIVRMNSHRYHVFKENRRCVCCNIKGTKMILDLNPGDQSPHFNLYAEESGRLVLMTKDHIVPKSRGGKDELTNYQSMCCVCNNLKGAYDLEMGDVRSLKNLWDNPDKLTRKDLRRLVNRTREDMARQYKAGKDRNECRECGEIQDARDAGGTKQVESGTQDQVRASED